MRISITVSRAVVIVLLLVIAIVGLALSWVFFAPNNFTDQNQKTIFVSKGQSFASIVDTLQARGVLRSRPLFVFVAKVVGGEKRMKIGKYVLQSGISNVALFRTLRDGSGAALVHITVREGLRSQAQARIFAHSIGIDSARYVELVRDGAFARSLGIDAESLEGYLLPETYSLPWQLDEKEVIRRQVEQFKRVYTDSLRARAEEIGWTVNQVLTLASIVEGEAMLAAERSIISGVYHNRLRRGMKLEADPTVQFTIEDGPRRVLYSDLRRDSPYNTYLHRGLPPGPINNPGVASILAALYPARHDYVYFVANGSGGHWFSATYADHWRFVRMYRKQRTQGHLRSPAVGGQRKGISSLLGRYDSGPADE